MKRLMLALLILMGYISTLKAQQPEYTHTITEIDRAVDYTVIGWAPDAPWLAYFKHHAEHYEASPYPRGGDLVLYNAETGQSCGYEEAELDKWFGNGENRDHNIWLEDNRMLSLMQESARIYAPCSENETDVTDSLPTPPEQISIVSYSPTMHTAMLRTGAGFYLFNTQTLESRAIEGELNSWGFYGGKGSVSPDGTRFAYTLSGPSDTYVIDIESAQAKIVVDETETPHEDECCTTPATPTWMNDSVLLAYTRNFGANGSSGWVIVDLTNGTFIQSPDPEFEIETAFQPEGTDYLLVYTRNMQGEYATFDTLNMHLNPPIDIGYINIVHELGIQSGNERGRHYVTSIRGGHNPYIFLPELSGSSNYAASSTRFAVGSDQMVSIYDLVSGTWIEVLAPAGYSRFSMGPEALNTNMWSADSQYLAMTTLQQGEKTLLVAKLEELPPSTSVSPAG